MKRSQMRDQFSGMYEGESYSLACGISFEGTESLTRQEWRDEVDIQKLIQRYGEGALAPRAAGGVRDFDLSLQEGLESVRVAGAAWQRLPEWVRRKYGNWEALLVAVEAGEYKAGMEDPAVAKQKAEDEARAEAILAARAAKSPGGPAQPVQQDSPSA